MPQTPKTFNVGDILVMKKNHACSATAHQFKVLRVGSDIRMVCTSCGHDVTLPRIKLEKNIKSIITENTTTENK